ncbi:Tautomerase/MIF superfamily [Melanogaster broomeanus]|nr:Tautomerase/MIF superfamily [Melanogaster broomeanus]
MPLLSLTTNVKLASEDATKAFVTDFSKFAATVIGKDEAFFSVNFSYNPYLTFAGTFDPAIMLSVTNLFNTNAINSRLWSKAFAGYFEQKLGVPSDRGYIAFLDPGPEFIGTRGTTFEALRASK